MPPLIRTLKALYLHDPSHDGRDVLAALEREFQAVDMHQITGLKPFRQLANSAGYDLLLCDYGLPEGTGVDAWNLLDHGESQVPFVLLSRGSMGEAESIDVMRSGVNECVLQEDLPRLGYVALKLLDVWQARQAKLQSDAALVVSRKQLLRLTQLLHTKVEEERAAVSREIHDDIGGALAAVKFDLAWIARHTADASVRDRVDQATGTLQQALQASQRIMLNLRPAILDEGLVPALQWMVNGFRKRTGADVVFRCIKEAMDLPSDVQSVAYSVVRESLTNVFKHASATRVLVDVTDQEGILTVEVTDNGGGLAPQALQKETSFGLLGLRERAQSVGGWLDVSSRKEGGVSVILSVPLGDAQLPDDLEYGE